MFVKIQVCDTCCMLGLFLQVQQCLHPSKPFLMCTFGEEGFSCSWMHEAWWLRVSLKTYRNYIEIKSIQFIRFFLKHNFKDCVWLDATHNSLVPLVYLKCIRNYFTVWTIKVWVEQHTTVTLVHTYGPCRRVIAVVSQLFFYPQRSHPIQFGAE